MNGFRIAGTGSFLPGEPVGNQSLEKVMTTDDDWIYQRTGIRKRHFAEPGQGPAQMGAKAAERALDSAGLQASDLDYILFNTMTPDHVSPGSGAILSRHLGTTCPALDLRTQCAAFLFTLQMVQGLVSSGQAKRILVVGAEAHAGMMPWKDWDVLRGHSDRQVSAEALAYADKHRTWSIIFGDGAGAVVFEATEDASLGIQSVDLQTDGRFAEQLWLPAGFGDQPFLSEEVLAADKHAFSMVGREIFQHAVTKLPIAVLSACEKAGVSLDEIDYFVAHQANQRINDAIGEKLGLPAEKVPSNIENIGNTSGGTIPILLDEMRRDGRLRDGQTICYLALGSGLHWGAAVVKS